MHPGLSAWLVIAAIFAVTFWLMRAMWRQMRRVNAHTAEQARHRTPAEPAPGQVPFEDFDEASGRYVGQYGEANEALIRQGARSRANGWLYEP